MDTPPPRKLKLYRNSEPPPVPIYFQPGKYRVRGKKLPVTAGPSSRAGRHAITDPFLRFYYRFIQSRLTQLEMGEIDQTLEELQKHMVDYIGTYTWEEMCREWTLRRQ